MAQLDARTAGLPPPAAPMLPAVPSVPTDPGLVDDGDYDSASSSWWPPQHQEQHAQHGPVPYPYASPYAHPPPSSAPYSPYPPYSPYSPYSAPAPYSPYAPVSDGPETDGTDDRHEDWAARQLPPSRLAPRHPRRGEQLHRTAYSAYSAYSAAPSTARHRPAASRAASLLLSTSPGASAGTGPSPGPGTGSGTASGMRHRHSAMPLLSRTPLAPFTPPRASTAPTASRRSTSRPQAERSPSRSHRAASRRDPSPRSRSRSTRHYRSTPPSRRSLRSSQSESDSETAATEQDDLEDERRARRRPASRPVSRPPVSRPSASRPPASRPASRPATVAATDDDDEDSDDDDDENHYHDANSRKNAKSDVSDDTDDSDDSDINNNTDDGSSSDNDSTDGAGVPKSIFGDKETLRNRFGGTPTTAAATAPATAAAANISSSSSRPPNERRPQITRQHSHTSAHRDSRGTTGQRLHNVYEEDAEEGRQDADIDMENDEDDERQQRRRATSRHSRRSVSRHTTATQDQRAPSRSKSLRRRMSLDEEPGRPSNRLSKRFGPDRSEGYSSGPATLRKSHTHPPAAPTRPSSPNSSVLGSFMGFSPARNLADRSRRMECVLCMREIPSIKVAKLNCGHAFCTSCVKRKFRLSISDPQQMPPKCCTSEMIPLSHVERQLDPESKRVWNQKFANHSINHRIYCPNRRCGEWIKPEHMFREDGRKVARCERCRVTVCCLCSGRNHASRECPYDPDTQAFVDSLRMEASQRCYQCKSMVAYREDVDHMICHCGAEACLLCGQKWKTCECPFFQVAEPPRPSYAPDALSSARTEYFASAAPSMADFQNPGRPTQHYAASAAPRLRPRSYEDNLISRQQQQPPPHKQHPLHLPYQPQESHPSHQQQQQQQQLDEDLARRMLAFPSLDSDRRDPFSAGLSYRKSIERRGFDNESDDEQQPRRYASSVFNPTLRPRRSFSEEDRRHRAPATEILMSSVPPPPPTPPQQIPPNNPPPPPPQLSRQHLRPQPSAQTQQLQPMQPLSLPQPHHMEQYPPSDPFERANAGADYYMQGVNRERGTRPNQRLADRFNSDLRTTPHRGAITAAQGMSPMGGGGGPVGNGAAGMPMGPLSPVGPIAPMGPVMPMTAAGPLPPPAMMGMPSMPMMSMGPMGHMGPVMGPMGPMGPMGLPPPPPTVLPETGAMVPPPRHPMDVDLFDMPDDRYYLSQGMRYSDPEARNYGPVGMAQFRRHRQRDEPQTPPRSAQAGLGAPGSGMDRVYEWSMYVRPGMPDIASQTSDDA